MKQTAELLFFSVGQTLLSAKSRGKSQAFTENYKD
jgi:hypothetical protein